MLPSKERLPRREFKEILENKGLIVIFNKLGTLKYLPSLKTKLSIITSGKHEKSAVKRNKLRRRLYTLFRGMKVQGLLYTAKNAYTLSFDELKRLTNDLSTKSTK